VGWRVGLAKLLWDRPNELLGGAKISGIQFVLVVYHMRWGINEWVMCAGIQICNFADFDGCIIITIDL
jgi:hypothetical protein